MSERPNAAFRDASFRKKTQPEIHVPREDSRVIPLRPSVRRVAGKSRRSVAKRVFDLVFATLGLVLLSPALIMVAIAIKLESRGPVFFRQTRHGLDHAAFRIWKFRTMTCVEDEETVRQAIRLDPRLTRIGAVLRRASVDELPQLFNVIMGEMSLVGPRPHAVSHNRYYEVLIPGYARRHSVTPGITGLAQVNGHRGPTETVDKMRRRVELDLAYVDGRSFWLDLKILALTAFPAASRNAF